MSRVVGRGRVAYKDAGITGRAVIDAALGAEPELRSGEWRVLLVVLEYTVLYSKTNDRLTLETIARRARRSTRQVRRHLLRLQERGLIRYAPGRGRRISTVSLPQLKGTSHMTPYKGTEQESPLDDDVRADDPSERTERMTPGGVDGDDPSTEKLALKHTEKTTDVTENGNGNGNGGNQCRSRLSPESQTTMRRMIEDLAKKKAMAG